jgi:hypothetical protein
MPFLKGDFVQKGRRNRNAPFCYPSLAANDFGKISLEAVQDVGRNAIPTYLGVSGIHENAHFKSCQ